MRPEDLQALGIPNKPFLSMEELQKILGLGRNQVYGLVRSGRIKAIRLGRRWLIPITVLIQLLEEGIPPGGGTGGQ